MTTAWFGSPAGVVTCDVVGVPVEACPEAGVGLVACPEAEFKSRQKAASRDSWMLGLGFGVQCMGNKHPAAADSFSWPRRDRVVSSLCEAPSFVGKAPRFGDETNNKSPNPQWTYLPKRWIFLRLQETIL